jgi:adenylate cyclase
MTVNPAGNRFCESCGSQLQQACAKCGHDMPPTARFCGSCGTPAGGHEERPGGHAGPKWGELKQATVLFADIVGSTEMIAGMDPEEAMGRLRPAVLRMRHSVERYGGTVVRTLGDGVMALFGVPRTLEGHALLACQAAMHMQKVFAQDAHGPRIRVGLHSGEIASDPQDARDGFGGGAHGLTIHLASRVVAMADPGGVCITAACASLAGPACETRSLGAHMLKGIPQAVALQELMRVDPAGAAMRGNASSTFRGRAQELEQLIAALDAPTADGVRAIGVTAEPGAGKSRLCQEFAQLCRRRGVPVHEVRAQLYGHALPLQPVLELFRTHFFGIAPGDGGTLARSRVQLRFEPLAANEEDLALLFEFFGVAPPGAQPVALGPRARQARLAGLLKRLVRHEPQLTRLIVIEDLHWLDEASEEFVSVLVDAVAGTRTLLVLNYRPAYKCPWLAHPHFAQIHLAELPASDMETLVAELMAPVSRLPELAQLVCRRAGGNPFFAEELIRSLAESQLLAADTGLPVGGIAAVERALPATVQAVVGARLDHVGEPEKSLLQMCAIIGKEIPLAVLQHVASPLAAQIERGLDGLCRAGLILPQPAEGGRRFAFRHPLIQEVAYSTQLRMRRGQVHANVATAMELYYAEQLDEYSALIGYHYEEAGQHLQSARSTARAAAWVGRSNSAQSIKHWRKVRSLLERVPRDGEVDRLRATAGAKIALLGWREGMTLEQVKPLIDEALTLSNEADDRLVPWLLTIEGRMLVGSGGPADGYVDCVKKALLYIDVDRDHGRVALAHAFLTQAYAWAGLLNEALHANDVALRHAHEVDAYDREFIGFSIEEWVLSTRAKLLARMGRPAHARECLERIRGLHRAAGEAPVPGMETLGLVELAHALEDRELAAAQAADLRLFAEQSAMPYVRSFMQGYRGLVAMLSQEHDAALDCLDDALSLIRTSGAAREYESEVLAHLAECRLRMGHHEQAHAWATQAIELARERTTRVAECRALIVRGAAALALAGDSLEGAQRDLRSAHEDFEQAERLIAATGAASCMAALATVRAQLSAMRAA